MLEESELQRALSENAALRLALKQAIEERDASAQKAAFATRRIEELQGKIRALMEQVALLERRIFAAKKERIDHHQQLDLEFAGAKRELDALQRELQGQLEAPSDATSNDGNKPSHRSQGQAHGQARPRFVHIDADAIDRHHGP